MIALAIATDEDIANRAAGDFPAIVPRSQVLARGVDGAISGWALASATNDFAAQGLAPGHMVVFYKPGSTKFHPDDVAEVIAVDSVPGPGLTLRRPGLPSGAGVPPTPGSGLLFQSLTADPQIARITYEVQRRFNIEAGDDLQDAEEIRRAVVLGTLESLYFQASRNVAEQSDDFGAKYKVCRAEFRAAMEELADQYGLGGSADQATGGPLADSRDVPLLRYPPYPH